jgi:hypothetical protein
MIRKPSWIQDGVNRSWTYQSLNLMEVEVYGDPDIAPPPFPPKPPPPPQGENYALFEKVTASSKEDGHQTAWVVDGDTSCNAFAWRSNLETDDRTPGIRVTLTNRMRVSMVKIFFACSGAFGTDTQIIPDAASYHRIIAYHIRSLAELNS